MGAVQQALDDGLCEFFVAKEVPHAHWRAEGGLLGIDLGLLN